MTRPADIRVLFLGCGDLGTGAAYRLFQAGFPLAIVELPVPFAVRRQVAFSEAARGSEVVVEGVACRRVGLETLSQDAVRHDFVPLVTAPIEPMLEMFAPHAVVEARMQKRPLPPPIPASIFVIALGPGHEVGRDCSAVIETQRGSHLGSVLWTGAAQSDTGQPGEVGGATAERVLRAPVSGTLSLRTRLGVRVGAGEVVATVGGRPVRAVIAGLVRGLLAAGDVVRAGQKVGDIDPRPDAPPANRITDKAHAVGAGVPHALQQRFQIELSHGL